MRPPPEVPEQAVWLTLGAWARLRRLRQAILDGSQDPDLEAPADAVTAVLGLLAWLPRLERLPGPERPVPPPDPLPPELLR